MKPHSRTVVLKKLQTRLSFVVLLALLSACGTQNKLLQADKGLLQTIDKNFMDGAVQYKLLMKNLPPAKFPKSFDSSARKVETSDSKWWCSGFYPGTLLQIYEQRNDKSLLSEAERMLTILEKEKTNTETHDLGFMMYCSFGNANRITSTPEYNQILLTSAKSLITRFNPKVGAIRSWNSSNPNDFLVIIDNMMNLELLFWATRFSGDSTFYNIATTHANTTIQNFFRPDNSSYHVVNYNPQTGTVQSKRTAQGYSDESAWARGQAWGLYGFTVMFRETKDKKYLQQAIKIADFILDHPNLPADKVPFWDFNAPGIPNALRDASAAAITASALLELSTFSEGKVASKYWKAAEIILQSLSSPTYKTALGGNGGFILMHGVGHMPNKTEVDVPLTYADYYFIEACKRYNDLARQSR